MKPIKNFLILICAMFIFISCDKQDVLKENDCDYEIVISPVCSFNPKLSQDVSFPVYVLKDGESIGNENYDFSWSSDETFKGSAISVRYTELPLIVTVTETTTNCAAEATLDKDYWD